MINKEAETTFFLWTKRVLKFLLVTNW